MKWFLGLLLLLSASTARADDEDLAQARKHYQRGIAHYNLEEYPAAIHEFEEAYRLHADSTILYNLAQTHRLAGNHERALHFYRAFLRMAPSTANSDEVQRRIADLEKLIADKKTVQKPPDTTMPPRDVVPEPKASPRPVITAPVATSVEVVEKRPAEKSPVYKKWWLWTAVVVVAGAAVGVGLGLGLQSTRNSYPRLDF